MEKFDYELDRDTMNSFRCYTKIIEESKNAVKLQVAEPGKEYMFKWCWKDEYKKLTGVDP